MDVPCVGKTIGEKMVKSIGKIVPKGLVIVYN